MTAQAQEIRLATPTAYLLGDPEPRSEEWFALRRGGITATDLPKILDMSKYGNARSVWHDKRGELPPRPSGEAAVWGHLLEDVVAREWARRNGKLIERIGVLANAERPWMRASLDRRIVGEDGALEVKTRSAYVAGKWREDIPDDVLAQVAWQRRTSGVAWIETACLLGGQRLLTFRYEEDPELEAYLLAAAESVWAQVQSGEPPPVEMDGILLDLLESLYPNRSGEKALTGPDAARLLLDYSQAAGAVKAAEQAKEGAKAAIVLALGDAEVLTVGGEPVFTYRQQEKNTISVADLEANDVELYLQVLEGGHINTTTSRVLRAAKRGTADGQ